MNPAVADHAALAIVMAAGDELARGEVEQFDVHRRQVVWGQNCLFVGDFDETDDAAKQIDNDINFAFHIGDVPLHV